MQSQSVSHRNTKVMGDGGFGSRVGLIDYRVQCRGDGVVYLQGACHCRASVAEEGRGKAKHFGPGIRI